MPPATAGSARRRAIAAATTLGLIGALAPQPALAQEPDECAYELDFAIPRNIESDMVVEVCGQDIELGALVDYQTMAEEDGVSLLEIIKKYHWQNDFAQVAGQLADAYPDDFAGSAIVDQSSRGWIAFKGEVPSVAYSLIIDLPKPVTLIGHRGFSVNELVDASE